MYLSKSSDPYGGVFSFDRRIFSFCLCWIAGIIVGTLVALKADASFFSLMRPAAFSRTSIVTLLLSVTFPFLIAAYAVDIHQYSLLFALCTVKAFCFSCCACLLVRSFGSAGWLIQPLYQFADTLTLPVLCWYGVRLCNEGFRKRDLVWSILISVSAAVFDFLVVSPWLAALLNS